MERLLIMHLSKIIVFIFMLVALLACQATGTQPVRPVRLEPVQAGPNSATQPQTGTIAALVWESQARAGDNDLESCQSLQIMDSGQLWAGHCQTAPQDVEFTPWQNQEWAEILDRFAPFDDYSRPGERLHFEGQGQVAGPAWQRAIAAWSRFTYQEQVAGRASASSAKTVLSWYMGEAPDRPGYCRHLTVLIYGYAYAEFAPCEGGGEVQERVGGWLETAEWEQFDGWLYSRGLTEQGSSYFSGQGTEKLTDTELANLNDWAAVVYDRLTQQ
jgi:hypothetical protein